MKKLLVLLFLFCNLILSATDYYIKNGGSDAANGLTDATAWATITKVNSFWSGGQFAPGDQILFKRGDTFYGTITASESGASGNKIIVGAYGTGVKPVISGFTTLTGWSLYSGSIYSKAVSGISKIEVVLINGVQYAMGRYPNKGTVLNWEGGTSTTTIDNQLTGTPNWFDAEIVVCKNDWHMGRSIITNHVNTTLTHGATQSPWLGSGFGYFIQNDLRTVTNFTEWHHTGTTLYVHFGGNNPADYTVKVTTLNYLFYNSGYSHITVQDISFVGANRESIYLNAADYITVQDCDVDFSGGNGIRSWNCDYNVFDDNYINHSSSTGFFAQEGVSCTVTNNTITNSGLIAGISNDIQWSGLHLTWNNNCLVQYNVISNSGYNGASVNSAGMQVLNNFITNYCLLLDDGGGVYTSGETFTNKTISDNIITYGIGNREYLKNPTSTPISAGVYLDESAYGCTVENNVIAYVCRAGIHLHKAGHNVIRYNTCFNNGVGIYYQDREDDTMHDNTVSYNFFIASDASQYTLMHTSAWTDIADNVTASYNYFCRPIDNDYITWLWLPGKILYSEATFAYYRTLTGDDLTSYNPDITITSEDELHLVYNETDVNKTFILSDAMVEVDGTNHGAGNLVVTPWTGKVLIGEGTVIESGGASVPTVTTSAITNITSTTATGGGYVTASGGASVTARGVCWSTSENPTTADSKTIDGTGIGGFTSNIINLTDGLTYYVKAYATNSVGTGYGTQRSFIAADAPPSAGGLVKSGTQFIKSGTQLIKIE